MTQKILVKIDRNDLVQRLPNISSLKGTRQGLKNNKKSWLAGAETEPLCLSVAEDVSDGGTSPEKRSLATTDSHVGGKALGFLKMYSFISKYLNE